MICGLICTSHGEFKKIIIPSWGGLKKLYICRSVKMGISRAKMPELGCNENGKTVLVK